MFRENKRHLQESLFSSFHLMSEPIKKKLMNSWANAFYNMVFCNIDETIFSALYCKDNGRPNFPVNILLSLEYIKHMFDYTDLELEEQFCFNSLISHAVGIKNVGELNFCLGTMYEFRKKLYNYLKDNPKDGDLIFNQSVELVNKFAKEVEIRLEEQRMDSTMISANIKDAGRLSLVCDVFEEILKVIPSDCYSEDTKDFIKGYDRKKLLYKNKGHKVIEIIEEILIVCEELISKLDRESELHKVKEIKLGKQFLKEQTKIDEKTGKKIAKENKEIRGDSMQSAYDVDATYRKKGKKSSKGYAVNITETCGENETQVITNYDVKKNTASDATFATEAIPKIKQDIGVSDIYVDGAYCGSNIDKAARDNEVNLHRTDLVGNKIDTDKFLLKDFKYDKEMNVIECPNGVKPIKSESNEEKITAHFSKNDCNDCPHRDKCRIIKQKRANKFQTTKASIKREELQLEILKDQNKNTSKRAAVEGTMSELKYKYGIDSVKVRGLIKVKITTGLKVTACNIRRVTTYCINKINNVKKRKRKNKKYRISMQF